MSPWTQLLHAVHAGLRGELSPRAVASVASRCRFLDTDKAGAAAATYNALKSLAQAWPDLPDVQPAIAQLISLAELNPVTFLPKPRKSRAATLADPWWAR